VIVGARQSQTHVVQPLQVDDAFAGSQQILTTDRVPQSALSLPPDLPDRSRRFGVLNLQMPGHLPRASSARSGQTRSVVSSLSASSARGRSPPGEMPAASRLPARSMVGRHRDGPRRDWKWRDLAQNPCNTRFLARELHAFDMHGVARRVSTELLRSTAGASASKSPTPWRLAMRSIRPSTVSACPHCSDRSASFSSRAHGTP